MNYTKTITDAVNGNKEALAALYEDTQNDMYYMAIKYTKTKRTPWTLFRTPTSKHGSICPH